MKLKKFDDQYRNKYNKDILGIDEAGRGPWAGPVVIVGIILDKKFNNNIINDSKQLKESQREELFEIINKEAKKVCIEIIQPKDIDIKGIGKTIEEANKKIANKNNECFIITDFVNLPNEYNYDKLTKADTKSLSVAAASIVAKVTRDRIMKEYGKMYPNYGFEHHKGYGTKKHNDKINKYGILDIHRKSFNPITNIINKIK